MYDIRWSDPLSLEVSMPLPRLEDWLARPAARQRASKLLDEQPLIRGSLVCSQLTCGKPRCRCTRGEKHTAWYLSVRHEGKRRMICVPAALLPLVQRCVKNHHILEETLDLVSRDVLDAFLNARPKR